MKVEYLPSFLKDLKALKSTPVFEQIKAFAFAEIPNSNDFRLFLTWYAKLTIKMPSKQTSIFVIFKISEAIRRTFY